MCLREKRNWGIKWWVGSYAKKGAGPLASTFAARFPSSCEKAKQHIHIAAVSLPEDEMYVIFAQGRPTESTLSLSHSVFGHTVQIYNTFI